MTVTSIHILQAQVLFQQHRYHEAEQPLRQALLEDPHNAQAHALLAVSLAEQKRLPEALAEAQQAIQLEPDNGDAHHVLAIVSLAAERAKDARAAAQEAIRLRPDEARYFATLSQIYLQERNWKSALEAAEAGRQLDPDNLNCINLQAMALVKLGRRDEAARVIETALSKDPENAVTHANLGWALLHHNQPQVAMLHFREALRLKPENPWARQGIVEALKARNLFYRFMLRYFLWIGRLSSRAQWGIILGGYLGYRLVASLAASQPGLRPVLYPLMLLYVGFALSTWVAYPVFNLLLRLDHFGRYALSPDQIRGANAVGACLLLAAILLGGGLLGGMPVLVSAALGALALILPVSGIFHAPPGKKRLFLAAYTGLLVLVGVGFLATAWMGNSSTSTTLASTFLLGWAGYSFVANLVLSAS